MSLHLQPVQLATGCDDSEGHLVFSDGLLIAVLVRLSELHEENVGMWYLESRYGLISGPPQLPFADLEAAQAWITQRLGTKRAG